MFKQSTVAYLLTRNIVTYLLFQSYCRLCRGLGKARNRCYADCV